MVASPISCQNLCLTRFLLIQFRFCFTECGVTFYLQSVLDQKAFLFDPLATDEPFFHLCVFCKALFYFLFLCACVSTHAHAGIYGARGGYFLELELSSF